MLALTLRVTGVAIAVAAVIGVPLGLILARSRFRAKSVVVALIYTGMGLPPVVVGLAVYLTLSRSGPLGSLGWLFTPTAMVVAQIIIALPVVAGLTMAAADAIHPELPLQLRSLGASPSQEARAVLREAQPGVLAALLAGFGAIISEVGAAMLVGGNIDGQTRVLSTAVVLETRRGHFAMALALGGALLTLAFVVNALLLRFQSVPRRLG
ncbi:MAG TPA: ABC transporter permease [Anaerolineales bacterium]|nr:ABC transporter permease [Anaerolineales bacterium]